MPSSVLMTAVTARAAGVKTVILASPRPSPVTLAAAAVADADMLLAAGGAQAVAALAYGAGPVPPSDVVVGPGNRWVTAAKQIVAGSVAIDMLAGPSELVVLADASAEPALVAADLLAQAEHDPEALRTTTMEITVKVNATPVVRLEVPSGAGRGEVLELARTSPAVRKCIGKAKVSKEIYVPGQIVNIVTTDEPDHKNHL